MLVNTKSGTFTTTSLYEEVNKNIIEMEKASRENPLKSSNFPIGYVLPLGTLGNAPDQQSQFKSNFHIVAYTLAEDLMDNIEDFKDFNIIDTQNEQGQIVKLIRGLNELAEDKLGKGWRVTLFNVSMTTAIESMCKGSKDIDSMKKSMDDVYNIVKKRLGNLENTAEERPLGYEIIELLYTPMKALSASFTKLIAKNSRDTKSPLGRCSDIVIETLVYDEYANGLRLLTNTESFASSKIRQYRADRMARNENTDINEVDGIYAYVLKARIHGENSTFKPIRQFSGKSQVSESNISGCSERIVYNIVNKNYEHWSFISLPTNMDIKLNSIG